MKDLDLQDPLYKLVSKLLKELKTSGLARSDFDLEVLTYIMFGSMAATIMLGEQHKGGDMAELAERFTNEWNRILRDGIFVKGSHRKVFGSHPTERRSTSKSAKSRAR